MIIKKRFKYYNEEFWKDQCNSAYAKISELEKELLKASEDVAKYKALYLQMLETNLNLANKVGVNNE